MIIYTHDSNGKSCNWSYLKYGVTVPDNYFSIEGSKIPNKEERSSYDIFNLEAAQNALKILLNVEKNKAQYTKVKVNNVLFDTDLTACFRYDKFEKVATTNPGFIIPKWKASGEIYVEMNLETAQNLDVQIQLMLSGVFTWHDSKLTEIDNAETQEDIEKIITTYP